MALNDANTLIMLTFFILAVFTIVPLISVAFASSSDVVNLQGATTNIIDAASEISFNPLTVAVLFGALIKLVFLVVVGIPFWLTLFMLLITIAYVLIIIKYIPGIGSGG